MDLQGWEIDGRKLPYWDNRDKFPCTDHLFESPEVDAACLIYSVTEVSMMAYRGFCAVLGHKSAPELLLCVRHFNFEPYVRFSGDGELIFLKAHDRGGKRSVLVLNLKEKAYAIVPFSPPDSGYEIEERADGVFEACWDDAILARDERLARFDRFVIDRQRLRFRKWSDLSNEKNCPCRAGAYKGSFQKH